MEPLVPHHDVNATESILNSRIKEVEDGVNQELGSLHEIWQKVKWSEAANADAFATMQISLVQLSSRLEPLHDKLHGVIGIDKQIAGLSDVQKIPRYICTLQRLMFQIGLIHKRIKKLETYCVPTGYRTAYTHRHTAQKTAAESLAILKPLFEQLDTDDPVERKKRIVSCELYLDILRAHKNEAPEIARIQKYLQDNKKAALTLLDDTSSLDTSAAASRDNENSVEQDNESIEVIESEYLQEYNFWKNAPNGTRVNYYGPTWIGLGNYQETGALGLRMDKEVGQPVGALIARLEERLLTLCKGNRTPFGSYKKLIDELNSYTTMLQAYYASLTQLRDQISSLPDDHLKPTVIKYSYGLQFALEEARSSLKLAQKLTEKEAMDVFYAMKKVSAVLRKHTQLDEYQKVFALYDAVILLENASQPGLGSKKSVKFVPSFFGKILGLLQEVHGKRDAWLLTLTADEEHAAETILKNEPVTELYEATESKDALPSVLVSYLAKRKLLALFLQNSSDMELELVLQMIADNIEYLQLYEKSENRDEKFKSLALSYEKKFGECRPPTLSQAADIAFSLSLAADRAPNIDLFAKGWQLYLQYCQNDEVVNDQLKTLFRRMLDKACQKHGYSQFFPEFEEKRATKWPVETAEKFTEQLRLTAENLRVGMPEASLQDVFNSVLLDALAESLHAAQDQREQAQQFLTCLYEHAAYQAFLKQVPKEMNELVCLATMAKLAMRDLDKSDKLPISEFEQSPLYTKESPIAYYLKRRETSFKDAHIKTALYKLLQYEETQEEQFFTKLFYHTDGRWFENRKALYANLGDNL